MDYSKLGIRKDIYELCSSCEEELKENPNRIESYVVMCWALVKNKQYAEAEERATEGLVVSPYDLRLIEVLGEAKYYLGKNTGAMEQFRKYVASAPESGSRVGVAYYYMGEIYIRKAMFHHADIALTVAVRFSPRNDNWLVRLGYAREMAKNYRESALAYTQALEINPTHQDAIRGQERISKYIY